MAPLLEDRKETLAMSSANLTPQGKAQLAGLKLAAQRDVATIRAALMPEDDDG